MKYWNILIVLVFVLGPPAAKWVSQLLARRAENRKRRQLEEARLTGRDVRAALDSGGDTFVSREGGAASADTQRKAEIAARRQAELEQWRAARVESGLPVSGAQGSRVRVGTAGSPRVDVDRRRREALEELRRRRTSLLQQRQDALGQGLSSQTGAPSPAFSQSRRRFPTSAPTGRQPVAASRAQRQQRPAGVPAPSPRRGAARQQQQQQQQRQQQQRDPGSVRRLVADSGDLTSDILQHDREHDVVTSAEMGMALDPLHPNRWSIKALRHAIIMKEILGPPVALRTDWTPR